MINENQLFMFEYTFRKPPYNIMDPQPIHWGLTGAVLGLKLTKNGVFELDIDTYEPQT